MKTRYLFFSVLLMFGTFLLMAQPTITSTSPAKNAKNVPNSSSISINFNESMKTNTLNQSAIIVEGSMSGVLDGSISYNDINYSVRFKPFSDFKAGEVITVSLLKGIKNASGVNLANAFIWKFTASSDTGTVFTAPINISVGANPSTIISADLDNDGDIDLITGNSGSGNLTIAKNNEDNTFSTSEISLPFEMSGVTDRFYVSVSDLNSDGKVDLIVNGTYYQFIAVYINQGSGVFNSWTTYYMYNRLNELTTADIDGDGDRDIITVNSELESISVLKNNGNGTFEKTVSLNGNNLGVFQTYPVGSKPKGITAEDVDSDGDLDIMTANNNGSSISVLKNNGDGTFASKTDFPVKDKPVGISSADIDGDGDIDLVVSNSDYDEINVLKNNGTGSFSTYISYSSGLSRSAPFLSDTDGDGDIDVLVAEFWGGWVALFKNNGDGTFAGKTTYLAGTNPTSVTAADYDNNGSIDLFICSSANYLISVKRNSIPPPRVKSVSPSQNIFNASKGTDIAITFTQDMNEATLTNSNIKISGSQSGFHSSALSFNHSTKKLTIDPDTDFRIGEQVTVMLKTNIKSVSNDSLRYFYSYTFSIANGEASGTFNAKTDYDSGLNPKGVSLADFDKDGDLDMVITNGTHDGVIYFFSILMNNNDGTFSSPVKYQGSYQTNGSTVADFNNDGYMDIAHVSYGAASAVVSLNNGDGTFGAIEYYSVAAGPISLNSADMDGDGDIDLVISTLSANISIILNDGSGVFGVPQNLALSTGTYFSTVADFDNDGDLDIAATTDLNLSNEYKMAVLINNGNFTFASPVYYNMGADGIKIASGDFNKDGYRDIMVANFSGNSISVFINNNNGTFADKVDYSTGIKPNGLSVADFNNDGSLDAVTGTSTTSDSLTIKFNTSNGTFPSKVSYLSGDNPFGIISGDLNNDGVLDLVAIYPNTNNLSVFIGNKADNATSGTYSNISYNSPTSLSGNVNVSGSLTVGAQITTGSNTIDLGTTGSITGETPSNYIVGKVQTTRTVSSAQSNIAGLGISIDPQSNNLGSTVIKRETGTAQTSESIKQVWTITPTTQPNGPVTVTLTWPSTNDNSVNLSDLVVYKSEDDGSTWNVISATINKDSDPRTATFTITSFSKFTVAESGTLPVELVSFTFTGNKLNWSTATETNNTGWDVEFRGTGSQELGTWKKVGFVAGKGTTTEKQNYSFSVSGLQTSVSRAEFRLKQIDADGKFEYSKVLTVDLLPITYSLSQNYPNPFNPNTVISYQLPVSGNVKLVVFDMLGREVVTLVNEEKLAGSYVAKFDGSKMTSGIYFYKITSGNFSQIKKMILMK